MDGDEPVGGEEKAFPVKFRIFRPKWASQELCNYWWSLDAEYRLHYGKPTHERATRGNPPRDRELPEGSVEAGITPIGLWRNCYNKAWLDSLEPYLLWELEIVEEDFDFNLEPPPPQAVSLIRRVQGSRADFLLSTRRPIHRHRVRTCYIIFSFMI